MSGWMLAVVPLAIVFSVGLVAWRVWPVLAGHASKRDDTRDRLAKWNRYLIPLFRKTLGEEVLARRALFFRAGGDVVERTMATWNFEASMMPDVEFIGLAPPGSDDHGVQTVATAEELRDLLSGYVDQQTLWGHTAWLYVLPQHFEWQAVMRRFTPVADFREAHGLEPVGD